MNIAAGRNESTDFSTYKQIMEELVRPINPVGLDIDTLKRLYESKMVYLNNLRLKCFYELNKNNETHFSGQDYSLILDAKRVTEEHLRDILITAIAISLSRCKNTLPA